MIALDIRDAIRYELTMRAVRWFVGWVGIGVCVAVVGCHGSRAEPCAPDVKEHAANPEKDGIKCNAPRNKWCECTQSCAAPGWCAKQIELGNCFDPDIPGQPAVAVDGPSTDSHGCRKPSRWCECIKACSSVPWCSKQNNLDNCVDVADP